MAYLGNAPARSFISFERQVFTIVNSQTAYTLDHSVTNENDIRLVVNNVVQEPGSGKAYTASGTTLTLSAALVNGTDEMYCVFLGRAVATNAPGAGSVGTSQLVDLNVTTAKIAADAVTPPKTNFFNTDPGNAADQGNLHIKTADSGATVSTNADELVLEGSGNTGLTIASGNTSGGNIFFADDGGAQQGKIQYDHSANTMLFRSNNTDRISIQTDGSIKFTNTPPIKSFDFTSCSVTIADNGFIDFPSTSGFWIITETVQTGQTGVLAAGGGTTAVIGQTGSAYNNADGGTFRFFNNSGTSSFRFKNAQGNSCAFGICHISTRAST